MISHWIIYGILIYVIYNLVRKILFPMFQVTKMVNEKMRDMQEKMQEMDQQSRQTQQRTQQVKEGDYIDYEEVK